MASNGLINWRRIRPGEERAMLNDLLCFLGFHRWQHSSKFLPSIYAEIVTEYIGHTECSNCGKVASHTHLVWDGKDMIEKT